jgi:hypothetical protein
MLNLPLSHAPTFSVAVQLGDNMRDKWVAFKRFIFDQHHILCLTICGLLGVGISAAGCGAHSPKRQDDTNVNYLCHLP